VATALLETNYSGDESPAYRVFSFEELAGEWFSFLSRMLRPKLLEHSFSLNTMWSDKPYHLDREALGFFESEAFLALLQRHFATVAFPESEGSVFPRILIGTTTMVASLIERDLSTSETKATVTALRFRYLIGFLLRYATPGWRETLPIDRRRSCLVNIQSLVARWFDSDPCHAISMLLEAFDICNRNCPGLLDESFSTLVLQTVAKLAIVKAELFRVGGTLSGKKLLLPITEMLLCSKSEGQVLNSVNGREAVEFACKLHNAVPKDCETPNPTLLAAFLTFADKDLPSGSEDFAHRQVHRFPYSTLQIISRMASDADTDFCSPSSRLSSFLDLIVRASSQLISEVEIRHSLMKPPNLAAKLISSCKEIELIRQCFVLLFESTRENSLGVRPQVLKTAANFLVEASQYLDVPWTLGMLDNILDRGVILGPESLRIPPNLLFDLVSDAKRSIDSSDEIEH